MWPAFVALTFLDGLVLHLLPPVRTGVDLLPGILLATFGNLVLIGFVGPWLAHRTGARGAPAGEGAAPPPAALAVLTDRVGTALLMAGFAGIVASGLATRPLVVSETDATKENADAVRDFVLRSGDPELIRNLETANTARLGEGYFRTCLARDERRRFFCLFVDTGKKPTQVVRDPNARPNSRSTGR